MYDEFIILSTDRIISLWDFRCGAWKEIQDWGSTKTFLYWKIQSIDNKPTKVYALLYENGKSEWLTEEEGNEFISIFKGRYGVNAVPQTEKEKV